MIKVRKDNYGCVPNDTGKALQCSFIDQYPFNAFPGVDEAYGELRAALPLETSFQFKMRAPRPQCMRILARKEALSKAQIVNGFKNVGLASPIWAMEQVQFRCQGYVTLLMRPKSM